MASINYKKAELNYTHKNLKIRNNKMPNVEKINYGSTNDLSSMQNFNFDQNIDGYKEYASKVILPYKDWIFGPDAIKNGQFGGNQSSLYDNAAKYINDPKIREIVNRYYPDATAEDLELLFYRMMTVGCGFIAAINTLLFEYGYFQNNHSMDDFYNRFGFNAIQGSNSYAYDYLFLDFFLYYAKEHEGYNTIEEVYGNAKEQRENSTAGDAALSDDEFNIIGMGGTYVDDVDEVFAEYLKTKGINIKTFEDGIPMSPEDRAKKVERDRANGITYSDSAAAALTYSVEETIEMVLKDLSLIMTVSARNYPLYYPYDADGNGKLDDVYEGNVGGHAMTVVGLADEPGKVVVSSWGEEYVMNIEDIKDFAVYDYSGFNGVESSIDWV